VDDSDAVRSLRPEKQRIPIRRYFRRGLGCDAPARTRAAVDDEVRFQSRGQLLRHDACTGVRDSARCVRALSATVSPAGQSGQSHGDSPLSMSFGTLRRSKAAHFEPSVERAPSRII
jgi:hypothetical protein